MANSVYLLVCDALSHIVSRRAAENIVRDALRSNRTDANSVTPKQMQDMLKGQVFARLQQIIPVAQAKSEIKALLGKLETMIEPAPAKLGAEVLEGLEALRAEFEPFVTLDHRRVKRIKAGIDVLADAPDPVRALNALWAELDLLFNELGTQEPVAVAAAATAAAVAVVDVSSAEPPLAPALNLVAELPAILPGVAEPMAIPPVALADDGVLEIGDDLKDTELKNSALEDPDARDTGFELEDFDVFGFDDLSADTSAVPEAGVDTTDPAEELRRAFEEEALLRQTFDSEAGLGSPSVPVVASLAPTPLRTPIKRASMSDQDQEALIARFALEEGVVGVTISDRMGTVLNARMKEGAAEDLAGTTAATVMLLESKRSFDVFYSDLGMANVFIAPLGDALLTILAGKDVNVGRVMSEVKAVKEDL